MSTQQLHQYYSVFPNGTLYKTTLDSIVSSEKLKHIKIHTAIWKFYLLIFPNFNSLCIAQENWMPIIQSKRNEFNQIRDKFHLPQLFELTIDSMDPLSKNEKSRWAQYHKDNELKNMIARDTNRLFHDVQFFHDEENIENINEIIFLHLRNFPEIIYYQGFHEICAIIYYFFCQEMKVEKETKLATEMYDTSSFDFIFSSDFIKADTFWVYTKIIEYIYKYYEDSKDTTIISTICYNILQIFMKRIDWDVSQKLTEDSNLNIMMYQWFRILFGRIITFNQINQIWSFIFSFFPEDKILSDISISLILSKKKEIINCLEPTDVLVIFKNMHSDNPFKIIKMAIKVQQPKKKSVKSKNKDPIYKYKQKQDEINKLRLSLFEPICKETENTTTSVCVKQKESIIDQLKKLRDAFHVVSALIYPSQDETNLFREDPNSENNCDTIIDSEKTNNCNDGKITTTLTNTNDDDNFKILPKATSGKLVDFKVDTSLLTKEDEEVFQNKSDIFSKPTNPKNLFD